MSTDVVNAHSRLSERLHDFFATKTACDVDGTMAYFAEDSLTYIDATLGWVFDSHAALRSVFEQYMPNWGPPARSYATHVLANETSALVHMVDTPELFGGELRVLAAIDLENGKIVRWVDYWDASSYDPGLYAQFRTPEELFPRELGKVSTRAASELTGVAERLHSALAAGDAAAAAAMMHTDVVLVDMALRANVIGRIETTDYLGRVLAGVPYGSGSRLRHVVGGRQGGGFEWTSASGRIAGLTAIELDDDGLITSITIVYDSRQISPPVKAALVAATTPVQDSDERGDL
jgi:ketosteroid isomerase-like protein